MTRIKKRRSGKEKTVDQQRTAAGRRMARKAAKQPAASKEQEARGEMATPAAPTPKKRYVPVKGGRRGGRAAKKVTTDNTEKGIKADKPKQSLPGKAPATPAKTTGKTRSAGARRVAVSRAIGGAAPKKTTKKAGTGAQSAASTKKTGKGFAPWNKNKFKGKGKGD